MEAMEKDAEDHDKAMREKAKWTYKDDDEGEPVAPGGAGQHVLRGIGVDKLNQMSITACVQTTALRLRF